MEEKYFELAGELADAEVTEARRLASKGVIPDVLLTPEQYKQTECDECGADLIEFRMQRGLITCTECQTALEKGRKNYAGYRG